MHKKGKKKMKVETCEFEGGKSIAVRARTVHASIHHRTCRETAWRSVICNKIRSTTPAQAWQWRAMGSDELQFEATLRFCVAACHQFGAFHVTAYFFRHKNSHD